MVTTTRETAGVGALRPLNAPVAVRVEADAGWPLAVWARGARKPVAAVDDVWRVEDEWWREQPVRRTYMEVLLDDGRRLTLFRDDAQGKWFRQRA